MRVTKRQLKKIIREAVEDQHPSVSVGLQPGKQIFSMHDFKSLQPGDKLRVGSRDIVVYHLDVDNGVIVYVDEGKATMKEIDYRYASIYPEDPADLLPEYNIFYRGSGPPPQNVRRPPRQTGPGRSFSVYD